MPMMATSCSRPPLNLNLTRCSTTVPGCPWTWTSTSNSCRGLLSRCAADTVTLVLLGSADSTLSPRPDRLLTTMVRFTTDPLDTLPRNIVVGSTMMSGSTSPSIGTTTWSPPAPVTSITSSSEKGPGGAAASTATATYCTSASSPGTRRAGSAAVKRWRVEHFTSAAPCRSSNATVRVPCSPSRQCMRRRAGLGAAPNGILT